MVRGGDIIALNPDGTEKWRVRIATDVVTSSPCISEDGTIYVGSANDLYHPGAEGYLHAFGIGPLEADANGPYYGLINQPVQFKGSSSGGYSPHCYHWNFGDGGTSEEQNPTHIYTAKGNYTVTLTVTDNTSNTSIDTTWAWIQTTNSAPYKPTIDGPTSGKAGTSYNYTFTTADPDASIIWYYVNWGDGSSSGWVGPYNSGEQMILSHSWSNKGTYNISAKAKDPYDAEGPWSYLEVTMPKNKPVVQSTKFLQILEQFMNRFSLLGRLLNTR